MSIRSPLQDELLVSNRLGIDYETVVGSATGPLAGGLKQRSLAHGSGLWKAILRSRWTRIGGPLLVLAIWELICVLLHPSATKIPSPWSVVTTLKNLVSEGILLPALWISVRRVLLGLALGVTIGSLFAMVSGLTQLGTRIVDPIMHMFRTMPVLALLPLFILWFGIGEEAKVYVIAWAVIFPIYINLYAGIRGVDVRLVEAGRVLGLRRWGEIRHVILPGALPEFLTGLRLATGLSWIVLVAAEEINASTGLGALIINAENELQTNVIFAALVVYSMLGVLSDLFVRLIERGALAWRSSYVTQ
jgi:sulfonate transport system permease protein